MVIHSLHLTILEDMMNLKAISHQPDKVFKNQNGKHQVSQVRQCPWRQFVIAFVQITEFTHEPLWPFGPLVFSGGFSVSVQSFL